MATPVLFQLLIPVSCLLLYVAFNILKEESECICCLTSGSSPANCDLPLCRVPGYAAAEHDCFWPCSAPDKGGVGARATEAYQASDGDSPHPAEAK